MMMKVLLPAGGGQWQKAASHMIKLTRSAAVTALAATSDGAEYLAVFQSGCHGDFKTGLYLISFIG